MKIRKGDNVIVIAGRDKGATGKVIQAFPKTDKVLVEGVNKIKKHVANSAPERGAEWWHCHPGSTDPRVQRHDSRR